MAPAAGAAQTTAARARNQEPAVRETWQAIYIGTNRVGYARTVTAEPEASQPAVVSSEMETVLLMSRFGQTTMTRTVTRTRETRLGDLLDFRHELQNPPAAATSSSGRVEGDKLILQTEINGKMTPGEKPWDKSVKGPAYLERALRENPLQPKGQRILKVFDPMLNAISTVMLHAIDFETVQLLDGTERRLLRVDVVHSAAPNVVTQQFVDAEGDALKTTVSVMTLYQVTKQEALKALSGAELDFAVATLIKVAPIDRPRDTGRVVYRIQTPGEDPLKLLAAGPTQQVKKIGPHAAELTVTTLRSPPPAGAAGQAAAEYLGPTRFLQSDDEQVRRHATAAAGDETDPWQTCVRLERWVYENLKKKNFSTLLASAAEVAQDLSGDCTEHAVLLAAMARARGVASRVAVGLVYVSSETSFGGHMWTEVFINGVWIPLDATLGRGGVAADHIKLTDSSCSDDGGGPISALLPLASVLGKMQIEVLAVVSGQ